MCDICWSNPLSLAQVKACHGQKDSPISKLSGLSFDAEGENPDKMTYVISSRERAIYVDPLPFLVLWKPLSKTAFNGLVDQLQSQ